MTWENLPLLIILALAVIGNNQSVAIAAAVLLGVKLLGLDLWLPVLEAKGFSIGLTILTISILVPIASGRITLRDMEQAFTSPIGIAAIFAGVFAAWAASRGYFLIQSSPEMVSSLIVGTVLGVCFLQGIPIGPLIAGGLVWMVLFVIQLVK